jgi:hypothetical protein
MVTVDEFRYHCLHHSYFDEDYRNIGVKSLACPMTVLA